MTFARQLVRGTDQQTLLISTTTNTDTTATMLVSLTVGKVDAGVAVLLTEDKRLVSTQPNTTPQS